jgi:hypothetical protein
MIKKLFTLLLFSPLFTLSQNTYDYTGRVTSDQSFNKDGELTVTRKYFYSPKNLTHELWYNSENKLLVRYNYNKSGNVKEIIKYSPWENEIIITDKEIYYYDNKGVLIFSLYTDTKTIIEKTYNSRGDDIHKMNHKEKVTIESILKNKKQGEYYNQNKGYKSVKYSNNVIKEEGFYENKMKEGLWVYYYNNGETHEEGIYYMGEKNETWFEYDKTGNLTRESVWYDGNLQSEVCWDRNNKRTRCK